MAKTAKSLPVITYHCVNDSGTGLTISPAQFEVHCRTLAEQGWTGVGLDEAEAFWLRGEPLPVGSLLITLDDGYLDNYVYAWPLLRKYGHKAVIFAVAEPVASAQRHADETGKELRPTIQDVWDGRAEWGDLPPVSEVLYKDANGWTERRDRFFTWDEARAMEASGVISIAAHSLGHSGIFISPEFTGFSRPGPGAALPFPHAVEGDFWGRPRFAVGSELRDRMFIPSKELLARLREVVPQDREAAAAFFAHEDNTRELAYLVRSFGPEVGRMETREEQRERLLSVMERNQAMLREQLGHSVASFSWPWGHWCDLAMEAAGAAGFTVLYTVEKGPNPIGAHTAVCRMNYKNDARKMLNRIRVYSSPLLGGLYRMLRAASSRSRHSR